MCRVCFHQATMRKSNQKIKKHTKKHKKTHNYPGVRYSTSHKGIGGCKKIAKISKNITTTLTYFDSLKKKQKHQGSKSWCYTFMVLKFYVADNLKSQNYCFLF